MKLGKNNPLVFSSKTKYNYIKKNMQNRIIQNDLSIKIKENIDVNKYYNLPYLLNLNGYNDTTNFSISYMTRDIPFWELLYQSSTTKKYYDYVSTKNCPQTISVDNLLIENNDPDNVSSIIKNDNRFTVMNRRYFKNETDITTDIFPEYKYIPFIDRDTGEKLNIHAELKLMTTASINETPYNESSIDRTSAYVYEPGNIVYILINTTEKKVYIMQTYKNNNPKIDFSYKIYLNEYLNDPTKVSVLMPSNFIFTHILLDNESMILLMTNPNDRKATILSDGIGNNYQYIRYDEFPTLYDTLFNNSKII